MKKIFHWKDSFKTGHVVIDRQHRDLLETLRKLQRCLVDQKGADALEQCLNFRALLSGHFAFEEDILEQSGFPRAQEHRAAHGESLARFDKIFSHCGEACSKSCDDTCMDDLSYQLVDHFLRGDLDFKSFLQTRNLAGGRD